MNRFIPAFKKGFPEADDFYRMNSSEKEASRNEANKFLSYGLIFLSTLLIGLSAPRMPAKPIEKRCTSPIEQMYDYTRVLRNPKYGLYTGVGCLATGLAGVISTGLKTRRKENETKI